MHTASLWARRGLALTTCAWGVACGARASLEDPPYGDGGAGGAHTTSSTTTTSTSSSGTTTTTTTSTSTTSTTNTGGGPVSNLIISYDQASALEAETSVIASGTGVVAAAWIAVDYNWGPYIGWAFSLDDGQSWLPPGSSPSPNGGVGADPVLAIDAAGNIYLTWVGYYYGDPEPYDMHIYVARAEAGSTSFGEPVEVTDPNDPNYGYDKPWITVTNKGTVLVTYARENEEEFTIMSGRSVDGGLTFTRTVLAPNTYGNLSYPCAPKNGNRVYATFMAFTNTIDVQLRYSDDDGATWPPNSKLKVTNEFDVAYQDPNCAAEGNEVWLSYGRSSEQPEQGKTQLMHSVRLAHSNDSGQSIDSRYDAHDPSAGALFSLPQLARQDNGALHLLYYAGQYDYDENATVRRASNPGGQVAFDPSAVVEKPVLLLSDRQSPQWLGDYTGLYVRGTTLYATYPVNNGDVSHVAFFKASLP